MIVLALCFIIWKFEVLYFQAMECRGVIQPDKEYIGGHESIYYVSSHSFNYLGGLYELGQNSIQLRFLTAK